MPIAKRPASKYGGNTSCLTLEYMGQTIIMDAGSGITQWDLATDSTIKQIAPIDILLSHLHIDHIVGLGVFSPFWDPHCSVRIHTLSRGLKTLKEQIFTPFLRPYWPLSLSDFANVECIEIWDLVPFELGFFTITPFLSAHPDYSVSFHITACGINIVYLLDSELSMLNEKQYAQLVNYCKNADLVIFDAAYSPADYKLKKGWGHSTIEDGFKLARVSLCKKMMFTHFSFEYSDQEIETLEAVTTSYGDNFFFARDGMEICLR